MLNPINTKTKEGMLEIFDFISKNFHRLDDEDITPEEEFELLGNMGIIVGSGVYNFHKRAQATHHPYYISGKHEIKSDVLAFLGRFKQLGLNYEKFGEAFLRLRDIRKYSTAYFEKVKDAQKDLVHQPIPEEHQQSVKDYFVKVLTNVRMPLHYGRDIAELVDCKNHITYHNVIRMNEIVYHQDMNLSVDAIQALTLLYKEHNYKELLKTAQLYFNVHKTALLQFDAIMSMAEMLVGNLYYNQNLGDNFTLKQAVQHMYKYIENIPFGMPIPPPPPPKPIDPVRLRRQQRDKELEDWLAKEEYYESQPPWQRDIDEYEEMLEKREIANLPYDILFLEGDEELQDKPLRGWVDYVIKGKEFRFYITSNNVLVDEKRRRINVETLKVDKPEPAKEPTPEMVEAEKQNQEELGIDDNNKEQVKETCSEACENPCEETCQECIKVKEPEIKNKKELTHIPVPVDIYINGVTPEREKDHKEFSDKKREKIIQSNPLVGVLLMIIENISKYKFVKIWNIVESFQVVQMLKDLTMLPDLFAHLSEYLREFERRYLTNKENYPNGLLFVDEKLHKKSFDLHQLKPPLKEINEEVDKRYSQMLEKYYEDIPKQLLIPLIEKINNVIDVCEFSGTNEKGYIMEQRFEENNIFTFHHLHQMLNILDNRATIKGEKELKIYLDLYNYINNNPIFNEHFELYQKLKDIEQERYFYATFQRLLNLLL